jgi:hypothetical protein
VYHGFVVLDDVVADGFTLGKITDFEAEACETGDAFIAEFLAICRDPPRKEHHPFCTGVT